MAPLQTIGPVKQRKKHIFHPHPLIAEWRTVRFGLKPTDRTQAASGFDFPTRLVGASTWLGTDGRPVTVYYDPATGADGLAAAQYTLAHIDALMAYNDAVFGVRGLGGGVIVAAVNGATDGTGGAYHYGCLLPGQVLEGRVIGGSKARYSGTAVEITTVGGVRLSVTPNHPVLTSRGFVAAGQLKEGDDLLQHVGESEFPGRADDEENTPALVEEAFDSFNAVSGSVAALEAPAVPLDFHGDAIRFKGEIQVVGSYCDLARHRIADRDEASEEALFARGGMQQATLARRRAAQQFILGGRSPASGPVGGIDLLEPGFRTHPLPIQEARFGSASRLDAGFAKPVNHRGGADAGFHGQLLRRFPGKVAAAKIAQVRRFHYDGPVYDFESPLGWILVNGICTSNCGFGAAGGDWYADVAHDARMTFGLVMAEVCESYMGLQAKGWNCGGSGGEGLSRFLAEIVSGGPNGSLGAFSSGASWDGTDWISRDQGTDQDYPSIGCAILYCWWMTFKGYTVQQITQAGEPNGTLATNYAALTGRPASQAFADFKAAVAAVGGPGGFQGDDPWNAPTPPFPLPAPQPTGPTAPTGPTSPTGPTVPTGPTTPTGPTAPPPPTGTVVVQRWNVNRTIPAGGVVQLPAFRTKTTLPRGGVLTLTLGASESPPGEDFTATE